MAITAVHHVALIVSDYERSKEFYVDKLGFQIVRENFREDRQDYKLDLVLDGVELEIFAPAERDTTIAFIHKGQAFLRHMVFGILLLK